LKKNKEKLSFEVDGIPWVSKEKERELGFFFFSCLA
jgi:hypothetical protein